jgi:hypothetical protein
MDEMAIAANWAVHEMIIPYEINREKRKEKSLWQ